MTPLNPLCKARRSHDLSQKDFAHKVGLHPSYICALEHGIRKPTIGVAKMLADYFGWRVEALFPGGVARKYNGRTGPREPYGPHKKPAPEVYQPPALPRPSEPAFYTHCPTCGAQGIFEPCYQCRRSLEAGA